MIAGLVVSSWLMTRMDNRLHKAYLLPEQSLVMESP